MDAPYTLLALPQPLDTVHGQTWSAPAYTTQGSRKRKRDELVVGIDGESVNIYKINNQALQSAYALPPGTYLCCEPRSYYSRTTNSTAAQRDTFVVLKDGHESKRPRLIRFHERISGASDFATPVKKEYSLPEGEVVSIQTLPSQTLGNNQSSQALITYSSGEVICVSENLSNTLWRQSVALGEESMVSDVFLEDVIAAQKGMLKSREDLVAALQLSDTNVTAMAVFIVSTPKSVLLRLYSITAGTTRGGMHAIDDIELPAAVLNKASTWSLSSSTGQLFQLSKGNVYVYDLTGITPRLHMTLHERGHHITSFTSLTKSLLMATTSQKALLYDLHYGSIQSSTDIPLATSVSRKRKRQDETARVQSLRLHWYSKMNIIIAASSSLVGIQVSVATLQSSRNAVRLSSVLGKSVDSYIRQASEDHASVDRSSFARDCEEYVASDSVTELETLVAKEFNLNISTDDSTPNGDLDESLWDVESDVMQLGVNQQAKALELLQCLFAYSNSTLRLRASCRNVLRWLYTVDILTSAHLSRRINETVTNIDIAQALVAADPSFLLVQDILLLDIHLPIDFLTEALRLVIRSLDDETVEGMLALKGQEEEIDHEAMTAEAELQNAMLTLHAGLEIRSITMQLLFGRLHAFPKAQITKSLRTGLQLRDLVFFIHLLRMELYSAGWTRPYVELNEEVLDGLPPVYEAADDEDAPSDRAVRTIGNLMLAAVDAIGISGWLVGLSTIDNGAALLDILQAEVAATIEGVYDAQSMQAYLDDFERYALSLAEASTIQHRSAIEVHNPDDYGTSMPLGGRSHIIAKQTMHRRGSKTPANLRARDKDADVGLYRFERIRV